MNRINFTVKIERTADCSYSLDKLLDYYGLSQEDWDMMSDDSKKEHLYYYIEDEIDTLVRDYDTEEYSIILNPDGNS